MKVASRFTHPNLPNFHELSLGQSKPESASPIGRAMDEAQNFGEIVAIPAGLVTALVFGNQAGIDLVKLAGRVSRYSPITLLALHGAQIAESNERRKDAERFI